MVHESARFQPDGNYLAASAVDGPVCLYQLTGSREQRRLIGHKFGAQCVAAHPRLPRFASAADDGAIIVWDAGEARPLCRWQPSKLWITGLAYSPDGTLLASTLGNSSLYRSASDNSIHLWDTRDGTLRKRLPRPTRLGVRAMSFDATGRRLASGDGDGTVLLWDVERGKILRRENVVRSEVTEAVFVNDGRDLIVGHVDGTIALFDLDGIRVPRSIKLPGGWLSLAVDGRSKRIIVGDGQGRLSALALQDFTIIHQLADAHGGRIYAVGLSPDGRLVATTGEDIRVVLRDARTFEPSFTFPTWTGMVRDLAFDGSGRWLAFAGVDADVALWDLPLLYEGLRAVGLAWDQPPQAVVPTSGFAPEDERLRSAVSVVRPNENLPGDPFANP
jgi:WD40 repeat protein